MQGPEAAASGAALPAHRAGRRGAADAADRGAGGHVRTVWDAEDYGVAQRRGLACEP